MDVKGVVLVGAHEQVVVDLNGFLTSLRHSAHEPSPFACLFPVAYLYTVFCLVWCTQAKKHIYQQPGELNVVLATKMLNPGSVHWMWLCRNLRLRTRSYLEPSRTPVPNFPAADAAVVERAIRQQINKAPPTLPTACVPRLTGSNGSAEQAVAYADFNWSTLHLDNPASMQLLAVCRNRMFPSTTEEEGPPGPPRAEAAGSQGGSRGGSQPASRGRPAGAGRRKPPAGRTGAQNNNNSSRPRTDAPVVGAVAGGRVTKTSRSTARSLRSKRVQDKMKKAHDAVVSAMMEEDERTAVVKPIYLVQQVEPHKLWPDGGVVVYAQFPFLLDLSWRRSGAWVSFCRKAVCAPDGNSQGGTYEVFFTLQKPDSSGLGEGSVDATTGADGATGSDGSSSSDGSGTDDDGGPRQGPGGGAQPVPPLNGGGAAGGAGDGGAPPDSGAVAPGAVGGGQGQAPGEAGAGPVDADSSSPRRGGSDSSMTSGVAGTMPGAPSVAPVAGGSGTGAGPAVDGGSGGALAAESGGARSPGAQDGRSGAAPNSRAVDAAGNGGAASAAGAPGGAPAGNSGVASRQARRASEKDSTKRPAPAPSSAGLHNLYTQAVRASNADMGFDAEQRVAVTTLAQSPPSSFFMSCSFFTDMDLDTTDPDQLSCQTDSYITAAYRARPKVALAVRKVQG